MGSDFLEYMKEVSSDFLEAVGKSSKPIRIIGNIDADGITSTSIICKALSRRDIRYVVSVVKQVNSELLDALKREEYDVIVFADLATAYLETLSKEFDKDIFVLDHHYPEIEEKIIGKVRQINPHLFNVDGTKEISAAGISYFFAKSIDECNKDMAHLALVGAIGDMQEDCGFVGMNQVILDDALEGDSVEIKDTLRLFGVQTKPLHKVLEYSTNPFIPGVTGSERGAIKFVEEAGIELYDKARNVRRLVNLSKQELAKLVTAIEIKKASGSMAESTVGPVFLLKDEDDDSLKKDLREFSTLLNSCGRMGWPSLGIGVCMGDSSTSDKANDLLREYRKEMIDALNWYYDNKGTPKVIEKKGYVIILAGSNIRDTIIGTLASLLAKSKVYPDGTIIMSTAYTLDGHIKVSLRITDGFSQGTDLRIIIKDLVDCGGGYGGGHKLAAGASVPQEKEDLMIREAISSLGKYVGNKSVAAE
ncbi:DHH family phosphoesterase [Candidatus Woesearchaeota archaeon]|jgi:single-stranded-DNA-specific exonuclease|nr:DHH family phosphoesterase [Candidatus Woesearchaeota archaeon]MBT5215124.1 DHH family phosphoesterase [Candidatus Woesearchaeota archaeon]